MKTVLILFMALSTQMALANTCITDEEAREAGWPAVQMSDISRNLVSFGETFDQNYYFDAANGEYVFIGVGTKLNNGNCGQKDVPCAMTMKLEIKISCDGALNSATAVETGR